MPQLHWEYLGRNCVHFIPYLALLEFIWNKNVWLFSKNYPFAWKNSQRKGRGSWWLHWLGWSYLKTYKAMSRRKWHGQVDLKPFLMYTGLHWWFTSRHWMSPLKVPFEISCHTKLCINPLHLTLEKALCKYIQNSLSESLSMHNGTWVSLYILTIESSHMHSNRVRMLI